MTSPDPAATARNARRFETYVRVSLYLFALVEAVYLLLVGLAQVYDTGWVTSVGVVVGLGHVVLDILVCRWAFDHLRAPGPVPRRMLAVWVATGAVTVACFLPWVSPRTPWPIIVPAVVMVSLCMLTPLLSWRRMLALAVAAGAALAALGLLMGMPWSYRIQYAVAMLVVLPGMLVTAWSMAWMLRVLYQLQAAQEAEARLAVADERLRISRDLHDVFGRTLATISVKSELAAQLVRRDRGDEAAEQLGEIRAIANGAGKEVRRVVRGDVTAGLAQEIDGARALLGSAGIATTVAGEAEQVPEPAAGVLGWVVREAVTNVLRHSSASRASIAVSTDDGVSLMVANDGADLVGTSGSRTGIEAMRDRLAPLGGSLEVTHEGGWFTLVATCPAPRPPKETR